MSEEQYLTNELYWEELIRQKDARIKWLETEVQRYAGEAVMANDRIEALEAALRNINDICHDPDHEAACMATIAVARAALAPEPEK